MLRRPNVKWCNESCRKRGYRHRMNMVGFPLYGGWDKPPRAACSTCHGATIGIDGDRFCLTCRTFNDRAEPL